MKEIKEKKEGLRTPATLKQKEKVERLIGLKPEDIWKKKDEDAGFYLENGKVVQRFAYFKISTHVVPAAAKLISSHLVSDGVVGDGEYWVIYFTQPSFPIVPEGECCEELKAETGEE